MLGGVCQAGWRATSGGASFLAGGPGDAVADGLVVQLDVQAVDGVVGFVHGVVELALGIVARRVEPLAAKVEEPEHRPDALAEGVRLALTDFPFEFGVRLGNLRVLVVAHVLTASRIDSARAGRLFTHS